ncbi:MAG: cytochrome c [Ignavibacteriaceae bacterium]|nr:cytochrome c [Ignavibacteriaceae bacterium]
MKTLYILLFVFAGLAVIIYAGEANKSLNGTTMALNKIDSVKVKKIKQNKGIGIGPVKKVKLGKIDANLVNEGKALFSDKCSACHSLDEEVEGPALRQITKQSKPEYIMNYLLNTTEMQKKDSQLKELIKKYNGEAMPDLGLKEPQARALLEYFRSAAR